MNKTSNRPKMKTTGNAQNVPFGVFGIMLPYKTVRSTHFSNLCVRIIRRIEYSMKYFDEFSGKNGYGYMLYH